MPEGSVVAVGAVKANPTDAADGVVVLARDKDPYNSPTPEQSWLPLARAGIELYEVPGNHITMNYAPHVQLIADRLRPYLDAL